MTHNPLNKLIRMATLASCLVAFGCLDLNVPNLNNPDLGDLEDNPTPSAIYAASTGLIIGNRIDWANANGYVSILGIIGRESYNFDAADPRYITELLAADQLDPGSPRFGGSFWSVMYSNIRSGNTILTAIDRVEGLTPEEEEAVRGFTKTMQVLDFLIIANTHEVNGAPVDVGGSIDTLAPIVSEDEVFTHVATLLDEAEGHLTNAGTAFPFPLSSGFTGFDTPDTFLLFNRALKARVEVYRGNFTDALDALTESFLVVDAGTPQFELGVYHSYDTGSGDLLNGLVDPNLFAHPALVTDAEQKLDLTPDNRVLAKIEDKEERTVLGLTSDKGFAMYDITTPVPIIRNEELILLRAEALIGDGQIAAAADDLNFIRVNSGGLEIRVDLDAGNIIDELLTQRRYSLMFEGGHRWIDARRHDRLDDLPLDDPGHTRHSAFPIPVQETDARN